MEHFLHDCPHPEGYQHGNANAQQLTKEPSPQENDNSPTEQGQQNLQQGVNGGQYGAQLVHKTSSVNLKQASGIPNIKECFLLDNQSTHSIFGPGAKKSRALKNICKVPEQLYLETNGGTLITDMKAD